MNAILLVVLLAGLLAIPVGLRLPPEHRALVAAGIALACAALLTAFMASQSNDPPNALIPRWIVIGGLFALPGTVGLIGALRTRRAVIVAAGLLCFGQAFLAFSLVTIPFLIPAVVLLAAGVAGASPSIRGGAIGLGIVVLGIAGWAGALGMTQQICWQAGGVAGCSSGQITAAGGALAAGAWLAAVALAALAPGPPPASTDPAVAA